MKSVEQTLPCCFQNHVYQLLERVFFFFCLCVLLKQTITAQRFLDFFSLYWLKLNSLTHSALLHPVEWESDIMQRERVCHGPATSSPQKAFQSSKKPSFIFFSKPQLEPQLHGQRKRFNAHKRERKRQRLYSRVQTAFRGSMAL